MNQIISALRGQVQKIRTHARSYLKLLFSDPFKACFFLKAFLCGSFYILYLRLTNPRVQIKWPLLVFAKFRISGPGRVFIDDSCQIFRNSFMGVHIATLHPQSVVKIGKKASLGGLTIRCSNEIEIGEEIMTGNSLIQDSLFYNCPETGIYPGANEWSPAQKVSIGNNVWIGSQCCILSGTSIGDNGVLSLGTVCHNLKINEYHIASGNPSHRSIPIEKILNFSGVKIE